MILRAMITGLVTAAAIGLGGCASNADFADIEIQTEANPKVNLGGYDTYAWFAAAAAVRDPQNDWTPSDLDVGGEIVYLVNREMRELGMSEVASDPDILVLYAVGVDMEALDVVVDPEDNSERFETIPKGGVLVVFADPETRQAIWAGSAVADLLEEPDRERTRARLDYAISEIFDEYPG